ncbi:response regulator [Pedobacter hartonius]|uniref:Response regulator receiver domain-containing protein n=1 Tax=Pedobacter hartonius TaxID=425514 RepID=A0A1H3WBF1_9SPHI|nr:response regulator [Pedobacter hartonius]SDZ83744.1 Response regulator receiver domain-containing protein [Pedobacter hartonius]
MRKVIVQDTNLDLLETMTIILEEAGYKVLPVIHYDDVIPKIIDFNPNIVLLDFRISGEESIAVCKKIKSRFPYLPVVALSCSLQIHHEYTKAGFDNYIAKPFDLEHLFKVLQQYTYPQ